MNRVSLALAVVGVSATLALTGCAAFFEARPNPLLPTPTPIAPLSPDDLTDASIAAAVTDCRDVFLRTTHWGSGTLEELEEEFARYYPASRATIGPSDDGLSVSWSGRNGPEGGSIPLACDWSPHGTTLVEPAWR